MTKAELERENAELKEKVKHRNCLDCSGRHSNIKLMQARKLLKGIVDTPMYNQIGGEMYENEVYKELIAEAEQFLKEVEK